MRSQRSSDRAAFSALQLVVLLALLLIGLVLLFPVLARIREAAAVSQSTNNVKILALAMHSYLDVNKAFPPAVGAKGGQNGPAHFHILPYLDKQPLFQNANGAVWKNGTYGTVVDLFLDPRDRSLPSHTFRNWLGTTNYPVNWMVTKDGKVSVSTITDGMSNTLMFAQRYQMCNGQPTAWGYPSIYTWAPIFGFYSTEMFQSVPTQAVCDPELPQSLGRAILIGMCDGSVRTATADIHPSLWYHLTDPSDGNAIRLDDLDK